MNFPDSFQLEAFQDAVYSWVKNAMEGKIPADRIIWRDQTAPLPRRPCVTLKVTDGPRDMARSGSRVAQTVLSGSTKVPTGRFIVGMQSEMTVSVQIYGTTDPADKPKVGAAQCSHDLNASLLLNQHRIPLRRAGVSVIDRGDVTNITALEETAFEDRYQFDVRFGVARNVIDDVGVIENVNGQGTAGTKTVPIKVRT